MVDTGHEYLHDILTSYYHTIHKLMSLYLWRQKYLIMKNKKINESINDSNLRLSRWFIFTLLIIIIGNYFHNDDLWAMMLE